MPLRPSIQALSRVVNRLRTAGGGLVSNTELYDALWYDDPGGGADDAAYYLRMVVHFLRQRGFPILNVHGRGYVYQPDALPIETNTG